MGRGRRSLHPLGVEPAGALVMPDGAKRRSLLCHPRRSEAEIALLSSPTKRSGDRGRSESPSLATPGQPAGLSRATACGPPGQAGQRLNAPARCHEVASPPPGSRLSPSGCPGGVRGKARRPRSPLRFVGDDNLGLRSLVIPDTAQQRSGTASRLKAAPSHPSPCPRPAHRAKRAHAPRLHGYPRIRRAVAGRAHRLGP